MPSFTKTAFNWFPRRERGLACGIFNSGSVAGNVVVAAAGDLADRCQPAGAAPSSSPA